MNSTIQILNPPLPMQIAIGVDNSGGVFLDTDEQFKVRMTKAIEELTEAQKIRQQAALTQSIPGTKKNRLILEEFSHFALDRNISSLNIEVRHKGRPLELDRLVVLRKEDPNNRIEIELFGSSWITDLEDLYLNQIELPEFEYTKANVEATWSDTFALAVAVPTDFGGWNTPGEITRRDLRFEFNLFQLMNAALCQKGWKFESPYFESAAGRSQYGYLSDEKWFSYEEKHDQFRVETNIQPKRMLSGAPTVLFDEVSDPFDLYNGPFSPFECLYPPAGEDNLEYRIRITNMTVTLKSHPPGSSGEWFMVIAKRSSQVSLQFIGTEVRQGREDQDVTFTINQTFLDSDCTPGTRYSFFFGYQEPDNSPLDWEIECEAIDFIPDPFFLIPDDIIKLNEVLSSSIPASDLYKAMSHICAGKTETDYQNKIVRLYSPFDHVELGETIKGFFRRSTDPIDITPFVQQDSMRERFNRKDQNRFIKLKFADSTDKYIEDVAPNPQLFERTVDLGFGKASETKLENVLFEPTNERMVDPALTGSTTNDGPTLRHMWDNTDGRISSEIGPRISYHYGLISQIDTDTDPLTVTINWEGVIRTTFGYLSQIGSAPIVGDPERVPIAFSDFSKDLYRNHYEKWLREFYSDIDIEVLIMLDYDFFKTLDFRKKLALYYKRSVIHYQLIAIRDFDMDADISTPIDIKAIEC